MKHFLYMDIDIINSIIAQSEKGLVANITAESQSNNELSEVSSSKNSTDGSTGLNIMSLFKTGVDFGYTGINEINQKTQESTKEIITKSLHDASFDMAYSIINATNIVDTDKELYEGEYVELMRSFDFIDFDYLIGLFTKDGIIEFIKKNENEQIEKTINNKVDELNRQNKRNFQKSSKDTAKKYVNDNNKKYEDTYASINALKNIIPCEKMLITSDGILIPTESKYFRINAKNMGFMYGGKIHCVGMVTNIVYNRNEQSDDDNVFSALKKTINESLRALLAMEKERFIIVHPIAIYYEA